MAKSELNQIVRSGTLSGVSGKTTLELGKYQRVGNIVAFSVVAKTTSAVSANDEIVSDLPHIVGNNQTPLRAYNATSANYFDVYINNDGKIRTAANIATGQSIRINGAYLV